MAGRARLQARIRAQRKLAGGGRARVLQPARRDHPLYTAQLHLDAAGRNNIGLGSGLTKPNHRIIMQTPRCTLVRTGCTSCSPLATAFRRVQGAQWSSSRMRIACTLCKCHGAQLHERASTVRQAQGSA